MEPVSSNQAPERDDFLHGVCVALQLVKEYDEVCWTEIVRTVGEKAILNYAAHIEPDEWTLAGFDQLARLKLGRRKPRKRLPPRPDAAPSTPPGYRLQPIAEYDAAAAMILQHADLVALVRRLSRALAQRDPNNPTAGGALGYLERIGEKGHVLR